MFADFPLWVVLVVWRLSRRLHTRGGASLTPKDVTAYIIALDKVKRLVKSSEHLTWVERVSADLLLEWADKEIADARLLYSMMAGVQLEVHDLPVSAEDWSDA